MSNKHIYQRVHEPVHVSKHGVRTVSYSFFLYNTTNMPETSEITASGSRSLTFMSNFPVPSPMCVKGDPVNNWEFFRQQWEDYEVATGLDKQDQKIRLATFRSVMGKECLQIFLNLKLSDDDRKDINACITALENYFKPKRNVVYERYMFNTCSQQPEESVDGYVNRLRKCASTCQFGTLTEELIRDRLVLGLRNQSTKLRLLKEEDLSLNKALSICRSSEIASQQMKAMKLDDKEIEEVRAVQDRKTLNKRSITQRGRRNKPEQAKKREDTKKRTTYKCYHCGSKEKHKLDDCPAKGKECKACKKLNHFASVCLSKQNRPRVNALTQECDDETSADSDDSLLKIEELASVNAKGKQLFTDLEFMDDQNSYTTKLNCQLDTGATCNVISFRDLSVIKQTGSPQMETSKAKLRLFDGSVMQPLGKACLTVKESQSITTHQLHFQVVDSTSKPLLSAETCETLGLIKINVERPYANVNKVQDVTTPLSREQILQDYKDVFEGLGNIGTAKFTTDPEVKPVQHAPRRIAVTLHKEVKAKIEELEKKNIIKKETNPTDWISSMVVVAKPGKIRICLDPKDLNQAVKRPKYQMPTLEEMLPRLNKAKVFTTLDAKDGFYQIALDEESSKLTTFWTPFGRYRYLRMPFGISAAPEEFECKLHERLDDLKGVEILRDDMLVVGYGDTQEEARQDHDENLLNLLNRAREVNLKLNSKKMNLRKTEVKFMGHVLSSDGIKPDPDKVKAVEKMPKAYM